MTATSTQLCEYRHMESGVRCSGEAEFVLAAHGRTRRVCRAIAQHTWAAGKSPCYQCRRPRWTHWTTEEIR